MNNTVRLLKGHEFVKNGELETFVEGSTIFDDGVDAIELKRWDIDDVEDARDALDALSCEADTGEQLTEITEYALEFFNSDDDGEFISGSDYSLAEARYLIDYGTGAGNQYAYSLEQAKEKAVEGIAYTQLPIEIKDRANGYEVIAVLPWYGVEPDEDDDPVEEIGGGFYGQLEE